MCVCVQIVSQDFGFYSIDHNVYVQLRLGYITAEMLRQSWWSKRWQCIQASLM